MSPRRARVLLVLTGTVIAGYAFGRADAAYGLSPLLILAVIALFAWLAGFMWAWVKLAEETAQAKHERDEINRQLSQLQDGGLYRAMTVHPAGKARLQALPKQAER